ncbi:MAG: MBL fold metallo-hydrolase [Spirochaetaceae bacterium]|jgi:glyoxylase-like metal-dependent hydrolase (beta-lactamase superfamily II)|nr:MBL fold metallo-hydrolase [Spirochaetaceae bacterium]
MPKNPYTLIAIDDQTTAIEEKRLAFQCLCYLLTGKSHALLIDTGFGLGDLAALVKTLTDKPVWVVNTHAHFDHIGNNHRFPRFFLSRAEEEVFQRHTDPAYLWRLSAALIPLPLRLLAHSTLDRIYKPKPLGIKTGIDDGYVFDPGGRSVEVVATPGHSPGSLCLLDRERRPLFTGDTLCDWWVLLNLEFCAAPEVYGASLERLSRLAGAYDRIYPGHHGFPVSRDRLEEYRACVRGILTGTIPLKPRGKGAAAALYASYGEVLIALPADFRRFKSGELPVEGGGIPKKEQ